MKDIIIVGGARDYHAVDWYKTVKKLAKKRNVAMLTDLIESEGYDRIVDESDKIYSLINIDKLLPSKQSRYSDVWRNVLKLAILPLQIIYLKKFAKKNNAIYHAHPMYYMFLCWLAKVEFIGTPQGSEILVRPYKSKLYKKFAVNSLQAAKYVTVDSQNMYDNIYKLSGVKSVIIQNGVDIKTLQKFNTTERTKITSIRGLTDLYRINEILEARQNAKLLNESLNFIYPFSDELYKSKFLKLISQKDSELGRLNKEKMYKLLSETMLVVSIPKSDSSPRSVYESIFLGCSIAATYNPYMENLPYCMKQRVYIVDLDNKNWFKEAVDFAKDNLQKPYVASKEAIEMFDQDISMQNVINTLYK